MNLTCDVQPAWSMTNYISCGGQGMYHREQQSYCFFVRKHGVLSILQYQTDPETVHPRIQHQIHSMDLPTLPIQIPPCEERLEVLNQLHRRQGFVCQSLSSTE